MGLLTHDPAAGGRWARIKGVFLDALDRPEPERAEFIARACAGDDDLRHEVEALLASDLAAGSFCETPATSLLAAAAPAADPAPRLQAGARLGPYEIEDFVGSGGMGEVYRARDTRLARTVAIKIVGAPLSDASARQRLLREARHASTLRHPNICAVHEVADAELNATLPGIPRRVAPSSSALADGRPWSISEPVTSITAKAAIPSLFCMSPPCPSRVGTGRRTWKIVLVSRRGVGAPMGPPPPRSTTVAVRSAPRPPGAS